MPTPRAPLAWAASLALALAPGCAPDAPGARGVVVLAAASLGGVLADLAPLWTARDGRPPQLSLAGSQTLAAQVRGGVAADVVATADWRTMEGLVREGLVEPPQEIATNRLVWIFRRGRDARPVPTRADFLREGGWRLALAAEPVPAGRYAREALRRLGLLEAARSQLVSLELDVRGVLSKVRLWEADVGLVYRSDVSPALRRELGVLELPAAAQVQARYVAAVLRDAPHPERGRAFVALVRSPEADPHFARAGFGRP